MSGLSDQGAMPMSVGPSSIPAFAGFAIGVKRSSGSFWLAQASRNRRIFGATNWSHVGLGTLQGS
jgi:hypothetical protein